MENLIVKDPPEFTSEIHKTEKKEFITADLENEIKSALLNNDVFLKTLAEAIQEKSNTHIENNSIHVTSQDKENWSGKAGTAVATQESDGLESAADKRKLDGVAVGAEVNQNAFSNVKVGNVTVSANGKTATFTLEAGSNITISADNASKKIVITANKDGGNADKLDGYHAEHFAAADHGHDGRYYTKTESNNLLSQKAASNHNHNGGKYLAGQGKNGGYSFTNDGAEDTGMFSDADGDLYFMQNGTIWRASHSDHTHDIAWGNISGKPSSYPPSNHGHDYLPMTGGTLSGNLNLQPPSGEGGQLELRAASSTPDVTGIVLDTLGGDFRIFGIASTKQGGVGSVIYINPYRKKFDISEYNSYMSRLYIKDRIVFENKKRNFILTMSENKPDNIDDDNIIIGQDILTEVIKTTQDGNVPNNTCRNVIIGNHIMSKIYEETYFYHSNNVVIGYNALRDICASNDCEDADENVVIGAYSARGIENLRATVCIGTQAGFQASGYSAGLDECVFIGKNSGTTNGDALMNSTAVGCNAAITGDDQVQLGGRNTTVYAYSALNNRSDKRDKIDIRDTQLGLDFLLKHRPVEFRWDLREAYQDRVEKEVKKVRVVRNEAGEEKEEEYIEKEVEYIEVEKDGSRAGKRFHEGFIAQEVEAIMEEMGVDFAGLQNHNISGGADRYTIGYTEYIPIIVKAIQELKQIYDEEVKHLKEEIVLLKNKKVV